MKQAAFRNLLGTEPILSLCIVKNVVTKNLESQQIVELFLDPSTPLRMTKPWFVYSLRAALRAARFSLPFYALANRPVPS